MQILEVAVSITGME